MARTNRPALAFGHVDARGRRKANKHGHFLVPVERIELPTFGLQNRLSVNRILSERVPKAKFVDGIIGYSESRN
jgi:hypothetical protein